MDIYCERHVKGYYGGDYTLWLKKIKKLKKIKIKIDIGSYSNSTIEDGKDFTKNYKI